MADIHKSTINSTQTVCAICKKTCSTFCSGCNKVSYCCKEHQKLDWKNHKSECFPAAIKYNDIVGRHLIATKTIKQGDLIFKEKPLVTGPNCGGAGGYYPICLSCFRIVQTNYSCSKCKWPLCGVQCEKTKEHANNECPIFCQQEVSPFQSNETFMYEKIIILRALLCKASCPVTWNKLLDLESHSKERKETTKGILLTKSAIEFIQDICNLTQFSEEEIDHIVGVLGTNAFWNNDNISSPDIFRSGSYLYYYGSFPAHNCICNSSWTIQMNSEFHLHASVEIPCGESITQLYTEATVGTRLRREHLKETKYFDCSCSRCCDSTELRTYFSAVKCQECANGYLIEISPLTFNSDWKCSVLINNTNNANENNTNTNTPPVACGQTKTQQYIEKILQGIRQEIIAVNNCQNDEVANQNDHAKLIHCINSLRQLLFKLNTKILHSNHYLIYEIENIIIQRISYLFAIPSAIKNKCLAKDFLELLKLMIDLSRKSLQITNVILPGYTTTRGRCLYFLQQSLTMYLYLTLNSNNVKHSKHKQQNSVSVKDKEQVDFLEILNEIERVRENARLILKNEPKGREEHLLAKFLQESSEYLIDVQNKLKRGCK